jgi:TetR/AcrR family transcriptional repressor of nem operon
MARKPEYSLVQVFDSAIQIISDKGYKACSMQNLLSHTQFNRRAFYQKFKHKQDFIEHLLAYYIEKQLLPLQKHFTYIPNKSSENKHEIVAMVNDFFVDYQNVINKNGCLLVKLIVEIGKQNSAVQQLAQSYYDSLQHAFIACLERAQINGELAKTVNIEVLAVKLTCFAQAFAVANNLQQGQNDVQIVINSLFDNT